MKVLVTGSAGFLGSVLLRRLSAEGHSVLGVDCRPDESPFPSLRHDLRAPLPDLGLAFDVCVHLASDVGGFLHNTGKEAIVDNELRLLETLQAFCRRVGCGRIVYTSSVNVFETSGRYEHGRLESLEQRTPYARAKALGERFVEERFDSFTVVRLTNLFGPAQRRRKGSGGGISHVIPDLLHKIRRGGPVEVLGDGRQQRNFLHVDDAARLLSRLLRFPARAWLNARSELTLSIGELVESLLRWSGVERSIVFRPEYLRYEPMPITSFDLSPLHHLGWRPEVASLTQGLGASSQRKLPTSARPTSPKERRAPAPLTMPENPRAPQSR